MFAAGDRSAWQGIASDEFRMTGFPEAGSGALKEILKYCLSTNAVAISPSAAKADACAGRSFKALFRSEILGPDEMELVAPL